MKCTIRIVFNFFLRPRANSNFVSTAGDYCAGYLPDEFAVIFGLLRYPLVVFIRLEQLYLDGSSSITFAPFNGIGFAGSPFLTAVWTDDFESTSRPR